MISVARTASMPIRCRLPKYDNDMYTSNYSCFLALQEEIPTCSTSNYQRVAIRTPAVAQITRQYPQLIAKQIISADRFIPRKSRYSVEAANYLLTKQATQSVNKNQLDVFNQVESLMENWRKKSMHQLMVKENVIPGLKQKQVLRANELTTENKLPGNLAYQHTEPWNEKSFEDGMWKSKPRRKPLIGLMDAILDMPTFRSEFSSQGRHRYRLIDWNAANIIAASIQDIVSFYNTVRIQAGELLQLKVENVRALKWSNNGDTLAIGSTTCFLSLFDLKTEKFLWFVRSGCLGSHNTRCWIRCICWSENDRHIITACKRMISVFSSKTGTLLNIAPITAAILTLEFSPTYRYLVASFTDSNVRILQWPSLKPFLDINYYVPVEAVAWHPHESGLLCIGGGTGDASLSLWNINKMEPLGYRRVQFDGAVENLAWNKITGELVVQWTYLAERRSCSVMPVLDSLDHVVDVIPIERISSAGHIMWNSDHTQLAVQADEIVSIWNFFGNEYEVKKKYKKFQRNLRPLSVKQNVNLRTFSQFNIR